MRSKIFAVGSIVMLAGLLSMAQTRNQQRGGAQPALYPNAVQTRIVTLAGSVTAVNMAPGEGMPTITLQSSAGPVTVLVGPYRVLADSKFTITPGETLEIKAFPDLRIANVYVATELGNTATGATVVLRDASGMPRAGGRGGMMMHGGGRAMGVMRGAGAAATRDMGDCPYALSNYDLSARSVLEGTVESVDMAAGQGSPTFTLLTGGKKVSVLACPYRLFLLADFRISVGDRLSVAAYLSTNVEASYLAAEINNLTTQKSLKLRV